MAGKSVERVKSPSKNSQKTSAMKDLLLKAGKERKVVDASVIFSDYVEDRNNDILRTEFPPKIPNCIGINGPPYKRLFPKPSC